MVGVLTMALMAQFFDVNDASSHFDFRIAMDAPCREECEGPAELVITAKGGAPEVQRIHLGNLWLVRGSDDKPLVNVADRHYESAVLHVGDFDFDGHEDIAVLDGRHGSYGGPTYTVLLWRDKKFVVARALGELTHHNLGLFDVDAKKKRLATTGKSGCCWHAFEEYAVAGGQPVLVARTVEDATSGTHVVITRATLVNGAWRRRTERKPIEQ
jgi:hypothetical protein